MDGNNIAIANPEEDQGEKPLQSVIKSASISKGRTMAEGWNDPPLFSYKEQCNQQPAKYRLNKRIFHPITQPINRDDIQSGKESELPKAPPRFEIIFSQKGDSSTKQLRDWHNEDIGRKLEVSHVMDNFSKVITEKIKTK